MKLKVLVLLLIASFSFSVMAQEQNSEPATYVGTVGSMTVVPSIASRTQLERPVPLTEEPQDGRSSRLKILIGKDQQTEDDYFVRNRHRLEGAIAARPPSLVFDVNNNVSSPSDPSLAVGPDHVFIVYNTGFIIYDKEGNDLTGPLNTSTIFPSGGCCDLTVSYDNAADRWVVTFLGGGAQVVVSDGPDPIASNWFAYNIPQISDYQKLSVWWDGYYMTDNTGGTNKVWAMDRTAMLAGDPNASIQGFNLPGIVTDGFFSPQALNISNDNFPTSGGATIVYQQDDAYSGVSEDHLKLWTIDVDFDTPSNSTVSSPVEIPTTPFIGVFDGGSFSNLSQPGGGQDIDALQATVMNQAQYRKFSTHNSAVFNFVVDTDAGGGELAGVRWFELRQDGDGMPWTIYQEGTYTAPDGRHAWHASLIMDVFGNIGMGYSSMSGPTSTETVRVSSYYTGRFASDDLNIMTVTEELIDNGTQNIGGFRYGDYSKIDVDPNDDKTFWFINEYRKTGGENVVGRFKIAPDFNNDMGVVSIDEPLDGILTASENVTVTIFNFGEDSQSGVPVELTVDGTVVANETFTGPLEGQTSTQYTFTTPVDFSEEGRTFEVSARTILASDEDTTNDSTSRNITHVFANDIGVIEITAPDSGEGLGSETITVIIENFGAEDQSNFPVSYTIDGGTPISETVPGPLTAGTSTSYTFATPGDFSAIQSYTVVASTDLISDSDESNDSTTKVIRNLSCDTNTNDTVMSVGPGAGTVTESVITVTEDFIITNANVELTIEHSWVDDLDIFLIAPDGTSVELSTDNGGDGDDYIQTMFSDDAPSSITTANAPFTGMFQPEGSLDDLDGLSSLGDWTLRITDDTNSDGGQLVEWSLQLCDDLSLGFEDTLVSDAELIIVDKGNDQFSIQLPTTAITERLNLTVTNMLGQTLLGYRVDNDGSGYNYDLDMSYAASGVYIVTLGTIDGSSGQTKRLIVR
ncbi:proprotein convertase P-domain-containing protein [Jejudonia soesokkakensis]|uniref:Proprotein convertase P-domain-containing protein n=1 Tax=Jejudonia soesokkakensis TaxID=1323432 RepID=A0ABW2MRQ2_9FLAO